MKSGKEEAEPLSDHWEGIHTGPQLWALTCISQAFIRKYRYVKVSGTSLPAVTTPWLRNIIMDLSPRF